jgi:hypothetical protein
LITAIKNISVNTPAGPSSPGLINAADFDTIQTSLNNFLV